MLRPRDRGDPWGAHTKVPFGAPASLRSRIPESGDHESLALQAVETIVSLCCGSAGLAYLLRPSPRARQVAARVALVGASTAFAALLGFAVLSDVL